MECEIIPVTRLRQNCSLVWCPRTLKAAVIDPGGDLSEILAMIDLLEVEPVVALVTHGHPDHCGAAARLARATGASLVGPNRADAHLLAGLDTFGTRYRLNAESFRPDRWLEHGDVVQVGETQLEVLHCPGHSRGHVAYFDRAARRAFVGDILFRGAIGTWEHTDGDLPMLVDSIRNRLFVLGDDVQFVPGHGPISTFGRERAENPFVGDEAMARWRTRSGRVCDIALVSSPSG